MLTPEQLKIAKDKIESVRHQVDHLCVDYYTKQIRGESYVRAELKNLETLLESFTR